MKERRYSTLDTAFLSKVLNDYHSKIELLEESVKRLEAEKQLLESSEPTKRAAHAEGHNEMLIKEAPLRARPHGVLQVPGVFVWLLTDHDETSRQVKLTAGHILLVN